MELAAIKCLAVLPKKKKDKTAHHSSLSDISSNNVCFWSCRKEKNMYWNSLTPVFDIKIEFLCSTFNLFSILNRYRWRWDQHILADGTLLLHLMIWVWVIFGVVFALFSVLLTVCYRGFSLIDYALHLFVVLFIGLY